MAWHGVEWPGLVLLLYALCLSVKGTIGKGGFELYRYETAYACEGKTLKIECKEGELIKLIRANYGRFSITICNDHGNTEWSVNCMSPKSLRVLHTRCNATRSCSIDVSPDEFEGDPCPGTGKYVEAQFLCYETWKEVTFDLIKLMRSLCVLTIRCSEHQNCSIPASTSMFGDPCQGTLKYLEAHYQCLPAKFIAATTTTTNRPSPPWLITSQPPMWSTGKTSARPPPPPLKVTATLPPARVTSDANAFVHNSAVHTSTSAKTQSQPVDEDKEIKDFEADFNDERSSEESVTLPYTTSLPRKYSVDSTASTVNTHMPSPSLLPAASSDNDMDNCSPITLRSIYWNWTRSGDIKIQPCPGGTTGFARWKCIKTDSESQWSPLTPDLSECRSVWLTSLEQRVLLGKDPLISITSDLAQVTSSKTLYGGDMMITTKIIQNMAHKMAMDIQTFPDTRQREAIVTELLNDVVRTGSNLLDSSQHPSWRDLSHKEQMRVATSLLIGLEENAFLLADTVTREKTVDQVVKNIMLSVRVLDTKTVTTERFPSNNEWSTNNDTIELPQGALLENSDGRLVRLVFVAFDRLEEILQWHPESSEAQARKNLTRILNSKVISASLGKGRHIQLREPVRLTLRHLQTDNVTNPSCVFWDYTTSTWSEEGCHVEFTNRTHTTCLCNHLTNFAILMDVRAVYLPPSYQLTLRIITYIGCTVSVVFLILTIITFRLPSKLESDRTSIHCNLCMCILIAEVLFWAGIGRTENHIVCRVVAASLQYIFLSAIIWLFFEGFHLYKRITDICKANKSGIKWYCYLISYGLPLLIVGISGAIFPQGYGTERYCWLQPDNHFIYSFVLPMTIVLLLNFIFLIMAIVKMCRHDNPTVSMKNKEHSRLASTRSWLKEAIVLVFLLGLTWTFGFLYLNKETVVMAYTFSILNALQGVSIFIFYCIRNKEVREEYRRFVRELSWLPQCLRCSKPGTTGGSNSGNSGSAKDSRTSQYTVGPNGNLSAQLEHSVSSPQGTSLQRDWNSRSLTNMNRVGKVTSPASAIAATLSRPPRAGATTVEPPNTSTLPYIRNFYKQTTVNANLPKSASTWGPLHKPLHWKNISFKSYSRDSGHGGSEQEDSPRSHAVLTDGRLNNFKDNRRQPYGEYNQNHQSVDYGRRTDSLPHPKHLPISQGHGTRRKNGNLLRAPSPWNHTYTEIHDERMQRGGHGLEDDPVYEEIERNEIQISDMSDEDGKRQSDMSRQSSRSYGDHRPLIPCSPANEKTIHSCIDQHMDIYPSRRNQYRENSARPLPATVLMNGETVVCHLEPDMYPHDPYNSLTLVQYGDS